MKIPVHVYMTGWEVHSSKHSTHIYWAASMYEGLWGHYSQVRVSAVKASTGKRIQNLALPSPLSPLPQIKETWENPLYVITAPDHLTMFSFFPQFLKISPFYEVPGNVFSCSLARPCHSEAFFFSFSFFLLSGGIGTQSKTVCLNIVRLCPNLCKEYKTNMIRKNLFIKFWPLSVTFHVCS